MRLARVSDGESFGLLTSNPRIDSAVQLDLKLVEAEQVTSPTLSLDGDRYFDGIRFDEHGNAVSYDVLRKQPGGDTFSLTKNYDAIPADSVLHFFRSDRPGQIRGTPDITPALPLFAQLRRFTLVVLAASETAADFAGILYTDAPAGGEADAAEPFALQVDVVSDKCVDRNGQVATFALGKRDRSLLPVDDVLHMLADIGTLVDATTKPIGANKVGMDSQRRAFRQPRRGELLCVALHGDYWVTEANVPGRA